MKAKLLIDPGFEAGSLYCGDCHIGYGWTDENGQWLILPSPSCRMYKARLEVQKEGSGMVSVDWRKTLRCQPCLDAEQKGEE